MPIRQARHRPEMPEGLPATMSAQRKAKPEWVYLRVIKGGLIPADGCAQEQLKVRKYKVGDLVKAQIRKPNNPRFNRLVHRIGQLCAANIEEFEGMDAHAVLKRLQWESNTWCEEVGVMVPGVGMAMMRFPLSLSFEELEDGQRKEVAGKLCRHIAAKYWPDLEPEQIEHMAESWVD